jgi:hypothetical protein
LYNTQTFLFNRELVLWEEQEFQLELVEEQVQLRDEFQVQFVARLVRVVQPEALWLAFRGDMEFLLDTFLFFPKTYSSYGLITRFFMMGVTLD